MVDVATHAVQHHRHWKRVYQNLQHKGNGKALIAVARQMLMVIWHLLSKAEADHNADPVQVANGYVAFFYDVGRENIPGQPSVGEFVREQLDDLGIGVKVKALTRNKETGKRMTGCRAAEPARAGRRHRAQRQWRPSRLPAVWLRQHLSCNLESKYCQSFSLSFVFI
jgi:hypothetical protein